MDQDIVRQLAAQPPPARRLWKYTTARSALARINELEIQLGLPQSALGFNLTAANSRICELESMVAARAKSAAPVVVAPVVEQVVEKFGRERFCAAVARDTAAKPVPQTHPELRGREKFCDAVRANTHQVQVLKANQNPVLSRLTGRKRFGAAVKKST